MRNQYPDFNEGKPFLPETVQYLSLKPDYLIGRPDPGAVEPLVAKCVERLEKGDESIGSSDIISAGCAALDLGYHHSGIKYMERRERGGPSETSVQPYLDQACTFFDTVIQRAKAEPSLETNGEVHHARILKTILPFYHSGSSEQWQSTVNAYRNATMDCLGQLIEATSTILNRSERPSLYFGVNNNQSFITNVLMQDSDILVLPALNRQASRLGRPKTGRSIWDLSIWRMPRTNEQQKLFFAGRNPGTRLRIEPSYDFGHNSPTTTYFYFREGLGISLGDQLHVGRALIKAHGRQTDSLDPSFFSDNTFSADSRPPEAAISDQRLIEVTTRARNMALRWL